MTLSTVEQPVKTPEEVKPVEPPKVESKPTPPVQVKDDKRLEVFLKPESIKAVIEQVKHNCQALLKPSTPADKEIAMKIKRAVAVPGNTNWRKWY